MHTRQTRRALSLIQTHVPSRTAATATKPAPRQESNWDPPQSMRTEVSPLQPNLSKWARPAEPRPSQSRPTYSSAPLATSTSRETAGKWILPSEKYPQPAHPGRSWGDRRGDVKEEGQASRGPRSSSSSSKWAVPSFPSWKNSSGQSTSRDVPSSRLERDAATRSPRKAQIEREGSQDTRLDRDLAPHQALDGSTLPSFRSEGLERDHKRADRDRALSSRRALRRDADSMDRQSTIGDGSGAKTKQNRYSDDADKPSDEAEEFHEHQEEEKTLTSNGRRGGRDQYKLRGSLTSRLERGEELRIPGSSRIAQTRPPQATYRRRKPKEFLRPANLDVFIPSLISVGNLSRLLNIRLAVCVLKPLEALQRHMAKVGLSDQSAYDHMLSSDYASVLALDFNRNPVVDDEAAFDLYPPHPHPDPTTLPHRPPVVTIMGHVDHGKTTLLDTLRSSSVAKGEAGGITQHIGAFSVPVPTTTSPEAPRTITFLDTPGHAAFSAMRARGAQVTDIIVLVVAADDGVKPQTKEVIELIKKEDGKLGVIVAINKVDKPGIDVEGVQTALWAEGLELEALGGDVPSVEVSGLTGAGLDNLIETISALAEMQDIRAETDSNVHGYVLESKMQKGHGASATVLLLRGSLTNSSHIISGTSYAKVRQLTDFAGKSVKAALPGTAVTVSGWKDLPQAGDEVLLGKESEVKKAAQNRARKAQLEATLGDAEAINERRRLEREMEADEHAGADAHANDVVDQGIEKGPKELRLVIKGDVSGSVEAVSSALSAIGNQHAVVKVVSTGVGDVTESDVMMAKSAEGMIVAFSVGVPRSAKTAALQNEVPVHSSSIIYELLDEIKACLIPLLPVIIEKRVTGEATVLQLFDIQLKGRNTLKVAGCRVSNGIAEKTRLARVIRNSETIHEGPLQTLRVLKRDVTEVKKGSECGMSFDGFHDLREGDFIQLYQVIEKPGKL